MHVENSKPFYRLGIPIHASDEMLAEWLANNPNAEIGTTVVIGAKLHVVTLGL
jgi:hypothetical protein